MTGNPAIDKIIMGINTLVVAGAVGLVYYSHNMIQPPKLDENKEFTNMQRDAMVELKKPAVVYDEIVVNLYSRERRLRFLKLQLNLEVFKDGQQTKVEELKPIILDSLIDITGNMKPDELNSITGKILLEARLKNKINSITDDKIIKKIFFSQYVVQ